MFRLFPSIPIFRGGGGLIKKCKEKMRMHDCLKIALLLVKIYFFSLNKDISELVCQIDPKHTANCMRNILRYEKIFGEINESIAS